MKHFLKILILTFVLLSIGCKDNPSKDNENKELIDDYTVQIDSLIETRNPRKFNGVILITRKDDTLYSKAYGYSDLKDRTPIKLNDNFRIQSNSKQVTAVLILKEVENEKINLESPINKYLPEIEQNWANEVTVHHLLNMSSGIESIDKPLLFEPGKQFYYSNPAYGLLGRIIEKVTGNQYVDMANALFEELAMDNTYCYELGMKDEKLINGYGYDNPTKEMILKDINKNLADLENREEWWKNFIPAGGIISNVNDLSIWDKNLHNGHLLKPETYELMTSIDRITDYFKAYGEDKVGYGYGVCISDEPVVHIGHPGTGLGFTSFKFYMPQRNLNVIVLQNIYYDEGELDFHFEKEIRKIVLNSNLVKK